MNSDFSKEESSLRNIENLFKRLEGRDDEQPLFTGMANMLVDIFFDVPRQKIHLIYELLTYLKEANWDVNLQNGHYSELSERLKRITNDLHSNHLIKLITYMRRLTDSFFFTEFFY